MMTSFQHIWLISSGLSEIIRLSFLPCYAIDYETKIRSTNQGNSCPLVILK